MRNTRWVVVTIALVARLVVPGLTFGDNPSIGHVVVPGDHVLPGETMQITAYDMDPGVEFAFSLTHGMTTVDLVRATVASDGTISTSALVPASFPTGYANVIATSAHGGQWSTSVLIGERAEAPGVPPAPSDGSLERMAALAALAAGLIIFIVMGARYLRR